MCLRKLGVFEDVGSCCESEVSVFGLFKFFRERKWKFICSIFICVLVRLFCILRILFFFLVSDFGRGWVLRR